MRPCDCKDIADESKLNEQGIANNWTGILVHGGQVELTVNTCKLKIPRSIFKRWCEWYMEDQDEEDK